MRRIPEQLRSSAIDILNQNKPTPSQKRALLLKKGITRSLADELELLTSSDEDMDVLLARIEKLSPTLRALIATAVDELKKTVQYAGFAGLKRQMLFKPLMSGSYLSHFKDGLIFEVVRRTKKNEVLAAGGRYVSSPYRYSSELMGP
jgi:translation initiation factor 2-alpha kinase 4